MVLDFVNKQEDIEADFKDYYGETTLDRGTDTPHDEKLRAC